MKKTHKNIFSVRFVALILLLLLLVSCATASKKATVIKKEDKTASSQKIDNEIKSVNNNNLASDKKYFEEEVQVSKNVEKEIPACTTKILSYDMNLKSNIAKDVDSYHIGNKDLTSSYSVSKLSNPERIVIDINNLKSLGSRSFDTNGSFVSNVRTGAYEDKTRLVFDIKNNQKIVYDVKSNKDGLDICISNSMQNITSYYASNNNENTSLTLAKNDLQESVDKNITFKDESINNKDNIQASNLALNKLNEQIDSLNKMSNESQDQIQNKIDNKPLDLKKGLVSKILGYEKQGKYEVQIAVNENVDYDLQKASDNEYILRIKNSMLSDEASKQIAISKNSKDIKAIKASKDKNDAIVKFIVQNNANLVASKSKIGIVVSENNNDLNNSNNSNSVASLNKENLPKEEDNVQVKEEAKERASIEKLDTKEEVKAQANIEKLDTEEEVKAQVDVDKLNIEQEGVIETQDILGEDDDEKGTGDKDEKKLEDIDEDLSKLLDPAAGYVGKLISLDFQDTDIDNALKIIAEVSNLNIVASDDVTGKISLRLNNVPWDQALDVILKTNGLDKVQEGNVIRIARVERLKNEREALKQARQAEESLEPLQLAYRKVSYAKAAELQALIETVLSDRGSVTFDDRSNQIFIKDVKSRIKDAFEIVKKADLRTPQILLETQIVEAQRNLLRELGSEFGFTLIESNETGNGTGYNFPSSITATGSNDPKNGNSFSQFPSASGSAVSLIFDSLDGTRSLNMRLSGLENEGKIRTISRPSVVTTNNTPAEIKSVESINVKLPDSGTTIATGQGASASGTSKQATESIDVGITLRVTPQASPDYYVLLDIMGESSQFGSREVDGIPSIVTRRATSTVLVSSGQTFALGGVYKVTDKDSLEGVPFLKDIPVLGHFFRRSKTEGFDEELLFFVTPRIVEGSFDDAK